MSSLILNVKSSNSGGSGGGDSVTEQKNESSTKSSIVVSAAVHVSSNDTGAQNDGSSSSLNSVDESISPISTTQNVQSKPSISPVNYSASAVRNSNAPILSLSNQGKATEDNTLQPAKTATLATVVVTAPPQCNTSSPLQRHTGTLGTLPVSSNSAATVITAVPPVSVKPLPMTTLTQQLPTKLPQQPSTKISAVPGSKNNQATLQTNQSTTVIGHLRNSLQPPLSFSAVSRPHQLTIPNVNHGKQSSPSPTITLSPIKHQGPQGATLVTAIQSSQAQHNPSGTVIVSNVATGAGATILTTHRQLHAVTTQPQRQLHQTVVQQSNVTRVTPTLITGHAPGAHHHVVQHHPPPLRMVQIPAGATSVTAGSQNITTRIAVSGSGSISSHVPPTTVSLPQSPAPIAIRHALPQSPLARSSPAANSGPCPQLSKSPVRHLQPQLPQNPVGGGNNQATTLLTTSRTVHSAPPAHLSSASIITHHPQQSGSTVVNRTALPLASVLASANQQRQLQQQLVAQRVLSTGPGGTTAAVVQGLQQPHPGLSSHSLSQTGTGTIMVNPHRPGTISMLPQVPASGTITAGGLIVHHPSSGGNILGNSNPSQGHHTLSASNHQLVPFPSNNGQNHTSNQRISLPTGNVLAHINGSQHHGGVHAVSGTVTSSGNNIACTTSITSNLNGRQIVANALSKSSTTILPPNALQHLLASHPHPQPSEDDLDVSEADGPNSNYHKSPQSPIIGITRGGTTGMAVNTGRPTVSLPSPRQQQQITQQRDRRSLPCQLALQDHNYYSRPPPTPPPPSQSPPILRDVLQEQQRRQQQLHQSLSTNSSFNSVLAAAEVHHQQQQLSPASKHAYVVGNALSTNSGSNLSPTTNRSAFSPPLQAPKSLRSPINTVYQGANVSSNANEKVAYTTNSGSIVRLPQYTPDSQKFAAAMVAAVTSPPAAGKRHSNHSGHSGIVAAVNGPSGSSIQGSTILGKNNAPHRVDAHFRSIQEAGVGPMAPLVDETPSDGESVSPTNEIDREYNGQEYDKDDGEETETAPEAEGEDDSITRCICDFLHDDGYMICCDKCLVWQHVVCMGLDRNNIPDEYLCEVCEPRPVDRKRAKAMQARRRSELYHHSSSSDESSGNRSFKSKNKIKGAQKFDKKNSTKSSTSNMKKILDKKVDRVTNKDVSNKKALNSKVLKKTAAQTFSMLNNKTNQTFASSAMIPQQLLPTNLLETNLNVLDDNNSTTGSPLSPLSTNSKLKKQYRKRKPSDKDLKKSSSMNNAATFAKDRRKTQQLKKQQNRSRVRSIDSDGGGDLEASTDEDNPTIEEVTPDASQHLRSWIDQYEEAVTNHYSPELRARLAGVGKWGGISNGELRPSVIGSLTRCNVSLQGNGVKILTASSNLSSNTPIIECKGKLMLAAQYRSANKKCPVQNDSSIISVNPYVFFYNLSDSLEICLDGKTYGNDSRFCRRSPNDYNAELRHFIDKGSLHLFIITRKSVEKNQEILLPPDSSCISHESSPLPSINSDLREITMKTSKPVVNGMRSPTASLISGMSSDADESTPLSSTRNRQSEQISNKSEPENRQKTGKEKKKFPKLVMKSPKKAKSAGLKENKTTHDAPGKKNKARKGIDDQTAPKSKKQGSDKVEIKNQSNDSADETDAGQDSTPTSPTKYGSAKPSPGKLGLPDNSGLIVGVNTINYDASSELKNKAKSREERKMEMIMKAFEAMEKAEQKKKETHADTGLTLGGHQSVRGSTDSDKSSSAHKRRRSSAKDIGRVNTDSNIDASSAEDMANDDTDDGDEDDSSAGKKKIEKNKKKFTRTNKGRKTAPNTPKRRRSRISSGGSLSGNEEMSVNNTRESIQTSGPSNNISINQNGPFRFPKTKKSMMSDWLQEANETSRSPNPTFCDDDDVSANYLKGSRSPPGIAMHLLRSSIGSNVASAPLSPNIQSPHSPAKSGGNHVCSAKKRWLRQAISEDHAPGEVMSPVHEVAFMTNGNSPGSSGESGATGEPASFPVNDYVTPLKKRRIQSYKDEQKFLEEEANASSEEGLIHPSNAASDGNEFASKISTSYNSYPDDVKVLPNGIKKKLLHNLVLEAVLDRAMEDMLNVRPKPEISNENAELEMTTSAEERLDVEHARGDESAGTVENGNTLDEAEKNVEYSNQVKEEQIEGNNADVTNPDAYKEQKTLEEKKHDEVEITTETKLNSSYDDKPITMSSTLPSNTCTSNIPEPSSVFKSFFKPSVSIEALEAQIEENKKLREAEQKQLEQLTAKQKEEEMENISISYTETSFEEKPVVPEQNEPETKIKEEVALPTNNDSLIAACQSKIESQNSFVMQSNNGMRYKEEGKDNMNLNCTENDESILKASSEEREDRESSCNVQNVKSLEFGQSDGLNLPMHSTRPSNDNAMHDAIDMQEEQGGSQHSPNGNVLIDNGRMAHVSNKNEASPTIEPPKPKEKRKFSLADYKRRRQQQQQTIIPSEAASPVTPIYKQPAVENQMQTVSKSTLSAGIVSSENSLDSCSSIVSNKDVKCKASPILERKQNDAEQTVHKMQGIINEDAESVNLNTTTVNEDLGASTPTMDEEQMAPATTLLSSAAMGDVASLPPANAPITLNTLPLFEKLEKLEKAQKENKKKALGNVSPPPEPKREDLTERLKKEFGLTVDGDEDDDTPVSEEDNKKSTHVSNSNLNDGDATPEEDSPHPPPSTTGASLSSIHRHPTMTRLPDQIAQYPVTSASSYSSSASQSAVESNASITSYPTKGQYNSSYNQNVQSGPTSRYSSHHSQQIRSAYQHSSGSYSQTQQHTYQRHSQPPSRSHLPVSHPGSRMTYPPPLPPASVIANAPHPNKINSDRDTTVPKGSNNFKRSNSSKEKDYYNQQHTWSSERESRSDRDREQRSSSGSSRSYYASTSSRGASDRSSGGSRSIVSGNYGGDKMSSREYNRREYSQIRTGSSSDRIGSHTGSTSLGTDRDLRGGGSDHGSSSSRSTNSSSRTSKSSYGRNSYNYN